MSVIGVSCRFQQTFSHITTMAACCLRRDGARGFSAAITDAPCRRHKYTTQSHYADTGSNSPGFILLMMSVYLENNHINVFDMARQRYRTRKVPTGSEHFEQSATKGVV